MDHLQARMFQKQIDDAFCLKYILSMIQFVHPLSTFLQDF